MQGLVQRAPANGFLAIKSIPNGTSVFYEGELSLEELSADAATAFKEFYFRASYIFKQLSRIRSFRDFLVHVRGWWEVVKYIAPWTKT